MAQLHTATTPHHRSPTRYLPGFTIVELLSVIVVIAILAAISIVAYTGVQDRARFASMRAEISSINRAIQFYYADNGSRPVTPTSSTGACSGGWCGFGQASGDNFVPGLSPEYIQAIPQLPSSSSGTYLYKSSSNGGDYKLIRLAQGSSLSASEQAAMADLTTTDCSPSINTTRWGYWSSNTSKCW